MIGIGLMGHGIASNLLKHGHTLVVLEHSGNQPLESLISSGATSVMTARQLAAQVDVIILCVTGSPQVEAVLTGDSGVLQGLKPGSIVIDCSTAIPLSTERMAAAVRAVGAHFLDAPMTRTAKEAAEGRLNLLVGGPDELVQECMPILRCFAENIMHAGGVGAGHRMKLLHNYVSLGMATLLAEAAASASIAGIDPQVFVDVLSRGGGAGVPLERLKPFITSGDASTLKFSIENAQKDLTYYNQMASDSGADRTVAAAVLQSLELANKAGSGGAWVPEMVSVIKARQR